MLIIKKYLYLYKWFNIEIYKDINILYVLLGFIAGIIGAIFSIIIRIELVYIEIKLLWYNITIFYNIVIIVYFYNRIYKLKILDRWKFKIIYLKDFFYKSHCPRLNQDLKNCSLCH